MDKSQRRHGRQRRAEIDKRGYATMAVLWFGGMCVAMTQSMVLPLQGQLPKLLHASASNTSWVVTATLIGGAVAMPLAGRLADILGKKPVLVALPAIMLAGSIICAMSDSLPLILTGRALQGVAIGYIPVAISLIREVTPVRMANSAIAWVSATLGVGGAVALPLSAWIAQDNDWHWLFWISAALALALIVLSLLILPNVQDSHPAPFDLVGASGLALGLVALLVGISKGTDWGWSSAATLATIICGVIVLLGWGFYELRHHNPLVNLRSTAGGPVLIANLTAILIGFGMMAQWIAVPQLLELPRATGHGLGQTDLAAALWLAPTGLMMLLSAPVAARLTARYDSRTAIFTGASALAAGYAMAALVSQEPWQLLVASSIGSAGVGMVFAVLPTLILQNVPPDEAASSVSVNSLMRSVGTAAAGAAIAAVLTGQSALSFGMTAAPTQGAFRLCFIIGAAAAALGALLALFIPRDLPAESAVSIEGTCGRLTTDRV